MAASPVRRATAVLPCDLTSAGAARRLLVSSCRSAGVGGDPAESAELLVSEVVTNAVLHGRSEVRLAVLLSGGVLRVEVGDDNSRHPSPQRSDPAALDGRGLAILDAVAARWGVEDAALGKVVWFELDL